MESNDLSGLIGKILDNPETMSSIKSIAEGLKSGDEPVSSLVPVSAVASANNSIHNLLQLLSALKPYLGEKKRKNVDDMVKVMRLIEVGQQSGVLKDLL